MHRRPALPWRFGTGVALASAGCRSLCTSQRKSDVQLQVLHLPDQDRQAFGRGGFSKQRFCFWASVLRGTHRDPDHLKNDSHPAGQWFEASSSPCRFIERRVDRMFRCRVEAARSLQGRLLPSLRQARGGCQILFEASFCVCSFSRPRAMLLLGGGRIINYDNLHFASKARGFNGHTVIPMQASIGIPLVFFFSAHGRRCH